MTIDPVRQAIRNHYANQGYEVRIRRGDKVEFRRDITDLWRDGRYVSEYRLMDDESVVLQ